MARREIDPIGAYRFILELGFLEVAGFSECTGLLLETSVFEYAEGGRNSHMLQFPERGAVGNITLKRGIVSGAGADALFNWHQDVMHGVFSQDDNPNRRSGDPDADLDRQVAILLLDEAGNEVRRWRLRRPFPVKWAGPELKGSVSELAVETLELACEGVEIG
jgi:phage tail-like protein